MTQKVTRGDETVYFREGWNKYLGAKRNASLCQLLMESSQPLRKQRIDSLVSESKRFSERLAELAAHEEGSEPSAMREFLISEQKRVFAEGDRVNNTLGLPWLTLVVGSGCVTELARADRQLALQRALDELWHVACEWGSLADGQIVADVVYDYASAMLSSRFDEARLEAPSPVEEGVGPSPHVEVAVNAVLAAALMQQFVLHASLLTWSHLDGESDVVDLPESAPESQLLTDTLLPGLRSTLRAFSTTASKSAELSFLVGFLNSVNDRLGGVPPSASIRDARFLGEIAWQLLVRDLPHYAGWHDMLNLLTIKTETFDREKNTPYLTDLKRTREFLTAALADRTRSSWRSRGSSGAPAGVGRMYDLVAEVADAQARMARDRDKLGEFEVPQATIFVTSLDLEAEMALFRLQRRNQAAGGRLDEANDKVVTYGARATTTTDDRGFIEVAPFEVVAVINGVKHAYLTWWWTRITPEEIDEVGDGRAEPIDVLGRDRSWSLATHRLFGSGEFGRVRLPVVVRLVGCPLLLPFTPHDDQIGRCRFGKFEPPALYVSIHRLLPPTRHASYIDVIPSLLLDENTAVHQALAELRAHERRQLEESDGSGDSDGLGLPLSLLSGNENFFRFWMLLGVQLSDDAVRMRVAATLSAPDAHGKADGPGPTRTGVALNLRSTPRERDVLHWQGFDVVRDRSESVCSDLEHYLTHLRARPEWHSDNACLDQR